MVSSSFKSASSCDDSVSAPSLVAVGGVTGAATTGTASSSSDSLSETTCFALGAALAAGFRPALRVGICSSSELSSISGSLGVTDDSLTDRLAGADCLVAGARLAAAAAGFFFTTSGDANISDAASELPKIESSSDSLSMIESLSSEIGVEALRALLARIDVDDGAGAGADDAEARVERLGGIVLAVLDDGGARQVCLESRLEIVDTWCVDFRRVGS